jgi:replicative superfamily II helicase
VFEGQLFLIGSVRLVLIDEVHMLAEDPRGATLESTVVRMKTVRSHPNVVDRQLGASRMRFVAVSGQSEARCPSPVSS